MRKGGVSWAFSAMASIRDGAFQHLEPVSGYKNGARGLVDAGDWRGQSVASAARRPWARRHVMTRSPVAPVDAEVERGGADHACAQLAGRHRILDLAGWATSSEP